MILQIEYCQEFVTVDAYVDLGHSAVESNTKYRCIVGRAPHLRTVCCHFQHVTTEYSMKTAKKGIITASYKQST